MWPFPKTEKYVDPLRQPGEDELNRLGYEVLPSWYGDGWCFRKIGNISPQSCSAGFGKSPADRRKAVEAGLAYVKAGNRYLG